MDNPPPASELSENVQDPLTAVKLPFATLTAFTRAEIHFPGGKPRALVKMTSHPTLPLCIWNYNDRVNNRHPLIQASRVLVTDTDGNVVSRSFSKFYNYHEKGAYTPTGGEFAVVVEEKVDGSIISVFWYDGQWIIVSKSAFVSAHVDRVQEMLDEVYTGAIDTFDKEKTYVFELVHPRLPQPVRYPERKLVLLTIMGKDGSEPPWNFDWSIFPFPRPRVQEMGQNKTVDFKALKNLNLINEEGFVLKFYKTEADTRPQRVKVKFELYLARMKKAINVTPRTTVDSYVRARSSISSLDWNRVVKPGLEMIRMAEMKKLVGYSDDFGGEAWLAKVEAMDTRVRTFFKEKELGFLEVRKKLGGAGFRSIGTRDQTEKSAFSNKIMEIESCYQQALMSWYKGDSEGTIIELLLKSISIPEEFLAEETLG